MKSIMNQSLNVNLQVMKMLRLYPDQKYSRFYRVQAYILYFLFIVPLPGLSLLYLLLSEDIDMVRVNYNAAIVVQTACFITKLLPFIRNGSQIRRCIRYFETEFSHNVSYKQKKIINDCIRICRRNSLVFLFGVIGGLSSWAINPLFQKDHVLPVDVWLPFDTTKELTIFYCLYLYLVMGACYAGFSNAAIDPLIAGLACLTTGQLKILKDNLQHLSEDAESDILKQKHKKNHVKFKIVYDNIQRCVTHHNAILTFAKYFEECFSMVFFSQMVGSIFVICFACLQLSKIQTFVFSFVQFIIYLGVVLAQIYFYCYYGATMFEESNTLQDAVYMGKWYELDVRCKKALIILMERSKRPILVTAGKLIELSLETFMTILRRSYSLLAVFKNY